MITISKLTALISLITLSTFFPTSYGYIMDISCETEYYDLLVAATSQAFTHARSAIALLENVNNPTVRDGRLIAQEDLISYLFEEIFISPVEWDHVVTVFKKVLAVDKNEDGTPSPWPLYLTHPRFMHLKDYRRLRGVGAGETIVYCDFKRLDFDYSCDFSRPLRPREVCDRTNNFQYTMSEAQLECMNHPPVHRDPNESPMFVYAWENDAIGIPSQIQWCGEGLNGIPRSMFNLVEEARNSLPRLTTYHRETNEDIAMDLLNNCLDIFMLHELTHAIGQDYQTDDEDGDDSYGWENAVRLRGSPAINNADNYAFFGAGASLITPPRTGDTPMRPNKNGQVELFPPRVVAKRDIEHFEFNNVVSRQRSQSFNGRHEEIYA